MTEKNRTTDDDAGKQLKVQQSIRNWLRNPKGKAVNVASHARPHLVEPPRRGELGDTELEEVEGRAFDRWLAKRQASAEIYAARALGDHRKALLPLVAPSESPEGTTTDDPAELLVKQIEPLPQKVALIGLTGTDEWQRVEPEDLSPAKLDSDLMMLADRYRLSAYRLDPEPAERARKLSLILLALGDDDFAKFDEVAGSAEHHLSEHNRGPRTRVQEATAFVNVVRRFLAPMRKLAKPDDSRPASSAGQEVLLQSIEAHLNEAASTLVRRVRSWPLLAAATSIPTTTIHWSAASQESVERNVARELGVCVAKQRDDVVAARFLLRAMGATTRDAQGVFKFLGKRY